MSTYPKSRARHLRKTETTAEAKAWQTLRHFRKLGFPVRRQHPIESVIVDFAIPKAKLVIEIDGGIHKWSDVALKDAERDGQLKKLGWTVLRIPNQQALHDETLHTIVAKALGI